jgi:NADH-quinone oxidoreductase subunit G
LAGTAKPARAVISAATAAEIGVVAGEDLCVGTDRGSLVLPVAIEAIPDRVVWVPTNARHRAVRTNLGVTSGATVRLTRPSVPPVVGVQTGGRS